MQTETLNRQGFRAFVPAQKDDTPGVSAWLGDANIHARDPSIPLSASRDWSRENRNLLWTLNQARLMLRRLGNPS